MTLDPRLFGSTPFGNRTAYLDLCGQIDFFGKTLARAVLLQTGKIYRTFPLGDGGGPEWLDALQKQYAGAAQALGLPPPPDLQSYRLDDPADWASWTFILGETSRQLQIAAGL